MRILIATKYRFIGDTLLSVPAIRAVAELWPDAKISVLTGNKALETLQHCPYVHDTIEFDPYRVSDKGLWRFWATVRELRKRHFDLALVFNRSFHSALISVLGGASISVGWQGFESRDFLLKASCAYGRDDCEIDSYLDIVKRAFTMIEGQDITREFDRHLEMWLTDEERENIPDLLRGDEMFIGMQPGASHDYKRWPAERFARLADKIVSMPLGTARIVLFGGPEEESAAQEMLALCNSRTRENTIDLTGKLPLRGTLASLARLTYFIGNDTAIRHGAVALGVPSLGLFGPTSAAKWGNSSPPIHQVIASPTEAHRMDDISVEEAEVAMMSVLPIISSNRVFSMSK
jgi:heptosyltransferase-2